MYLDYAYFVSAQTVGLSGDQEVRRELVRISYQRATAF